MLVCMGCEKSAKNLSSKGSLGFINRLTHRLLAAEIINELEGIAALCYKTIPPHMRKECGPSMHSCPNGRKRIGTPSKFARNHSAYLKLRWSSSKKQLACSLVGPARVSPTIPSSKFVHPPPRCQKRTGPPNEAFQKDFVQPLLGPPKALSNLSNTAVTRI